MVKKVFGRTEVAIEMRMLVQEITDLVGPALERACMNVREGDVPKA